MNSDEYIKAINGSKIYEILSLIRKRHTVALTDKTITALANYLWGYWVMGTRDYDFDSIYNEGDPDFNEFKYWLHGKPNIPLSTGPPFHQLLLEKTNNDEAKAFELFFEKLDEYFLEKGKKPYFFVEN